MHRRFSLFCFFWCFASVAFPRPCPFAILNAHFGQEMNGTLHRLVAQGEEAGHLRDRFELLIELFAKNQHRILDPLSEGYFLRGAFASAESARDINVAIEMLREPSTEQLRYFAQRLAFFARKMEQAAFEYPTHDERAAARAEMERFDIGNRNHRHIVYDPATGRHHLREFDSKFISRMRAVGLAVQREPAFGFHFNNGRWFVFSEHPVEEFWAARQIAIQSPGEIQLAHDDPSTRQFFRVYQFHGGRIHRNPPAADFLFIRATRQDPRQGEFVIRELKFHRPDNDVHVEKALLQLHMTMENLIDLYPDTPIGATEIVVPERRNKLNSHYRVSKEPAIAGSPVFYLLDRRGDCVILEYDGRQSRVLVRLIPPLP